MKVSVIIPIYNTKDYVEECIRSVLNQSLGDIEVICVNDHGDDDSWEIVKRLSKEDDRIILLENDRNRGLSYTRNHGLSIASGDYVYFLDSDDYIVPECLKCLYENAAKYDLDIQAFEAEFIYESEELKSVFSKNPSVFKSNYDDIYDGESLFIKWINEWDWIPSQPRFFYSREFLVKNDLSFTVGMLHEDEIFTFDALMKAERVKVVKEKYFCRRFRGNSIMSVKPVMENYRGCILILQHVYKYMFDYKMKHSSKADEKSDPEYLINAIRYYMGKIAENARNKYKNIADSEDKNPIISVIIPCFNVEKYIEECISSVLLQGLWNIEIIAINDGSTDATGKFLYEFEKLDPRIKVYEHPENRGQSSARNLGLSKAIGRYIYMLDADDYIVDNALEELYGLAVKDNADVIAFENRQFSDCPEFEDKAKEVLFSYKGYDGQFRGTDAFSMLVNEDIISPSVPTYMIKKEYIDRIGLRFIENIIHEDIGFILEMLVFSDVTVIVDKPYFMRRFRKGSTVTSGITSCNIEGYLRSFIRSYEISEALSDEQKDNIIFMRAFRKWQRDVFGRIRILYLTAEESLYGEKGGNVDWPSELLFEAVKLTTTGPARASEVLRGKESAGASEVLKGIGPAGAESDGSEDTQLENEVYISGTGQYANRLIDVIGALDIVIKGIIDTHRIYKGRTLRGFRVFKPEELDDKEVQILLGVSHYSSEQHYEKLKEMGFSNIRWVKF